MQINLIVGNIFGSYFSTNKKRLPMSYDPRFQESFNGPLTKHLRDRISAFREGYTLAEIGSALGFSGPFVSQLLNPKHPARVQSKHMARIIKVVRESEKRDRIIVKELPESDSLPMKAERLIKPSPLKEHVDAINQLGYAVTLTPLKNIRG